MSEAHRLVAINEMTKLMQPYGAVKGTLEMVHNICILNPYKILHLSGYIDNIVGMFIRSVLIGNSHIYFRAVVKVRYNTKLISVVGADLRTGTRSGTCSHETLDVYEIMPVLQTNVLPAYPASCASSKENDNQAGQVCMNYEEPYLITIQNTLSDGDDGDGDGDGDGDSDGDGDTDCDCDDHACDVDNDDVAVHG
uniref:Uncharacterized protein n=1 Tax=Glossina palpalis gambiensis TaxID=67801 RepID=A0A1B0B415_9MUSC